VYVLTIFSNYKRKVADENMTTVDIMSPSSIVDQFVFNPGYQQFFAIKSNFESLRINQTNFKPPRFLRVEDNLFSSSNSDEITCPHCFTPQSVFCVVEDVKEHSKKIYICMSHGDDGCGWQGEEKPIEDDTKKRIKEKYGFIPLRLN
ncbi:17541_t:CDS:2, partial [Cetraspora pellucida]